MAPHSNQPAVCLSELPENVLCQIIKGLKRTDKHALFHTSKALRTHTAFKPFFRSSWSFYPVWDRNGPQRDLPQPSVHDLETWPAPAGGLRRAEFSGNLQSRDQHYEVTALLEELRVSPRARQVLATVKSLCLQNMTASSKQEQALVHVVQGLLRVCPRASDVTLPHVPAATLRYLVQPAAAHTAMTSLSLLTWNEAPTGDRYHAAFDPAATTRALCSLTRLTTLNLAVLGCGPYGLGSFMKYTRHNRHASAQGSAVPDPAPGLDLTPLSALTALTSLALSARSDNKQATVICTGIRAIATRCTRLKKLELRSRMLMDPSTDEATSDHAHGAAAAAAPHASQGAADCAAWWPSLEEVVFEDAVVPSEVTSLQLLEAPKLRVIELLLGLDLPHCNTPEELSLAAHHLRVASACLARVCPTQLTLHRLLTEDNELSTHTLTRILGTDPDTNPHPSHTHHNTNDTAIDGHLLCDVLGHQSFGTKVGQLGSLLTALEPLARRLRQLTISGNLLQTTADAVALAHALPALEQIAVGGACWESISAIGAASRHLRQLRRLELRVGRGGAHSAQLLLGVCAALHQRVSAGGSRPGTQVTLLLVGCGRKATETMKEVKERWEAQQHSMPAVQSSAYGGASRYVQPSMVQVEIDTLPDL